MPRCMPSLLSHHPTQFLLFSLTSMSECRTIKERSISDNSACCGQEIRAEYVRHFLSDEFVVGREKEARLFKSIIDKITAEDVQQVAEQLRSSASCVVKAVSHRRHVLVVILQVFPDTTALACLVKVLEKCMAHVGSVLHNASYEAVLGLDMSIEERVRLTLHGQGLSSRTEGWCCRATAVPLGSRPAVCR